MRISVKLLFVLALAGFITSCSNNTDANHEHSTTEATHEHAESETADKDDAHSEPIDDIGVSLDNGKKWSANAETTSGIANMIKLMKGFSDHESVVAYAELNKDLQNEFALIFELCTMTGESHIQLHNYLVPIKEMFAGLISTDINTCKSSYKNMAEHLSKYANYFE